MGTRNFGPAVGSKSSISIIDELTYGRLRIGTDLGALIVGLESECYIPFTTESIAHTINTLESATLDPSRGSLPTIRGTSDVGGDIAFELRGQGYGQLIKQAMGDGATGSANYVFVANCRGDLPLQVDGLHALLGIQLNVKAPREVMADWATLYNTAGASFVHIARNVTTGLLIAKNKAFAAAGVVPMGVAGDPTYWHHITVAAWASPADDPLPQDGEWVFPVQAAQNTGCYLHYLELGVNLPIGLDVDIMRDIALFVYSGMKVGTWTMNFNANEIVNGTFTFMGREEFCGGVLTSAVNNIATGLGATLIVDDARIFCAYPGATSKFMLGHEGDIYYTGPSPLFSLVDPTIMDNPVPVSITTPLSALGDVREGTDQVGVGPWTGWSGVGRLSWGYFKGTPVVPMTGRACTVAGGPANLRSTMVDLPPYSFFEATILMSSGLSHTGAVGGTVDSEGRQGVEEIEVMNATFTVEQNLYADKYALGSRYRVKAIEQKRTVTGTLSFEFDNLNQYRKFFDGRSFAFLIKCISVDPDKGLCGTGTNDVPYSACFYFDNCKYTGATPNANGPDMIMTDMPFSAAVKNGDANTKAFTELAVWMTNERSITLW